jgi:Family of unknown function (DUF6314)
MHGGLPGHYRRPHQSHAPTPDTLVFLRGAWHIDRELTDHLSGVRGTFTGEAEFAAAGEPSVLRYSERGELRFGGHVGPASRSLVCVGLAGGAVDVRFADGRDFYRLNLASGRWRAKHACARDDYVVTFRVLSADLLEERWRAAGPQKDYVSTTLLERMAVSSDA